MDTLEEKTQDDTSKTPGVIESSDTSNSAAQAEIAAAMGILGSAAIVFAKDVALNSLKRLLVSSRHKQSLVGSEEEEPAERAARVAVRDSSAERSEQNLVEQHVAGSQEEVQGNGNEVVGVEIESTASTNSAQATTARAGASDISTEALEIN